DLAATGNAGIDYFYSYGPRFLQVLPLDSTTDTVSFLPLLPGVWEAQKVYADLYDSGQSNVASEVFDGITTAASDVGPLSNENSLSISPNPSASEFRIQGMKSGSFFVIYNALGIPIFQSRKDQFIWEGRDNSGNLCSSGHYFAAVIGHRYHYVISILLVR
ncbi:MAG TPA: hypothetical protein VFH95_09040, partial [Candidatus Kapabacteria bacterium]|nr:hypothetical protein [Candidatus Kapabacteria bacterium]